MITGAIEVDLVPTAEELRLGGTTALLYSRAFLISLAVLGVFEFLVFGIWGHSLIWGVVIGLGSCLVLFAAMLISMNVRFRTLRQPTHISVSSDEVHISRPETASQYKLSQFRKWLTRSGNYVLLGRSQPRMFIIIPGRAISGQEDRLREVLTGSIGPETIPWLSH